MSSETPVDIEVAAKHFAVSTMTVRRWVRAGMPCLRPSERTLRFILSDCVEWMKSNDKAAV